MSDVTLDEERNGWLPDPFGRFEERYIVYGEPSRLVRSAGVEQTDRQPLTSDPSALPAAALWNGDLRPGDWSTTRATARGHSGRCRRRP